MSVFPIDIQDKEDTPERLLALAAVPLKNKILASEFTTFIKALRELDGRAGFITDSDGKEWFIRKANGNTDTQAFEADDRIEAFKDATKKEWIEGVIMGPGFSGVLDLEDANKFFKTGGKIRL